MEKSEKIWMDGKLIPWHEANVHVLTHTLHYGLGVFEGLRCYQAKKKPCIFRLAEHVDRLFDSAKIMGIKIPFSPNDISKAIRQTVAANKLEDVPHDPAERVEEPADHPHDALEQGHNEEDQREDRETDQETECQYCHDATHRSSPGPLRSGPSPN